MSEVIPRDNSANVPEIGTRDPASTLRGGWRGAGSRDAMTCWGPRRCGRFPLFWGVLLQSHPNTKRPFPFAPLPLVSVFHVRLG